jgi:UDP-glucuronate decarboxylase
MPLPIDDPQQRRPDISVAERALGWGPEVQLREGPERTIAYFENLLSHKRSPRQRIAA